MIKKTRVLIFSLFFFLFLVIAPLLIFNSLGYKFDFEQKKFIETGGIHIISRPSPTDIFIDGIFETKTGAFLNSAFISDLLPKEYEILIEKKGYTSWKKNLEIEEGKITRFFNVLLFKENISFDVFRENVRYFSLSPTGEKLIVQKKSKEFELLEKESSKEFSLKKEIKKTKWHPTEETVLIKTETQNLVLTSSKEIIPFKKDVKKISLNPKNEEKIFYLKNNDLYLKKITEEKEPTPLLENIITYTVKENNVFTIDDSGFLKKTNFKGEIEKILNQKPFSFNQPEIKIISETVFLKDNGKLLFINDNLESFKKIYYPVKEFSSSHNQIVFHNNHEIWLLNLKDLSQIKERDQVEKTFLNRFSEKIKNCFWLNNNYLIFNLGDKIKISETDTRDILNMNKIAKFENPKIHWNNNKLYVLENEILFISKEIIP